MSIYAGAATEVSKANVENVKEVPNTENMNELPTTNFEDVENQPEGESRYIICINESLEGDRHPITGVEFEKKEVELPDGIVIEGVFPEFESVFDAQIEESQYEDSDAKHFKEANEQLQQAIETDPDLREQFTEAQLEDIEAGDTPGGYVWHHSEEAGVLQLVESTVHTSTGHTGGRYIWGGGSDKR